jgi:hypothetical protein
MTATLKNPLARFSGKNPRGTSLDVAAIVRAKDYARKGYA